MGLSAISGEPRRSCRGNTGGTCPHATNLCRVLARGQPPAFRLSAEHHRLLAARCTRDVPINEAPWALRLGREGLGPLWAPLLASRAVAGLTPAWSGAGTAPAPAFHGERLILLKALDASEPVTLRQQVGSLSAHIVATWRSRYVPVDGIDLEARAILNQEAAAVRAQGTQPDALTVWMRLTDQVARIGDRGRCSGLHLSAVGRALIGLNRLALVETIGCVRLTLDDIGRRLVGTDLHSSAPAHARWD